MKPDGYKTRPSEDMEAKESCSPTEDISRMRVPVEPMALATVLQALHDDYRVSDISVYTSDGIIKIQYYYTRY